MMVPFPPGDHQHADFVIPAGGWFRDYATNGQAIVHVMSWLVKNGKEDAACAEKAEAVSLFEHMLDDVQAMGFEQYQGAQRLKLTDSQLPARLRSSDYLRLIFRVLSRRVQPSAIWCGGRKAQRLS